MDSVHHSRARVLFEVFCALGLSASLVGAWQQTFASALLAAAGCAGLLGLVRAFDLIGRKPAVVSAGPHAQAPSDQPSETMVATEPSTTADSSEAAEPAAPAPAKAPRKPRARRSGAAKQDKETQAVAPAGDGEVVQLRSQPEPDSVDAVPEGSEGTPLDPEDEASHMPVAPLFEPEPFVRQQQRAVFGRKAG